MATSVHQQQGGVLVAAAPMPPQNVPSSAAGQRRPRPIAMPQQQHPILGAGPIIRPPKRPLNPAPLHPRKKLAAAPLLAAAPIAVVAGSSNTTSSSIFSSPIIRPPTRIPQPAPLPPRGGNNNKQGQQQLTAGALAQRGGQQQQATTTSCSTTTTTTSKPITMAAKKDLPEPVAFLYNLFGKDERGELRLQHLLAADIICKPSQQATDAYDLAVVNAIREGNLQKLRNFLNKGRSLEACNKYGESLLHMACRRGDLETVRFLIHEANVPISSRDDFGRSPIHDACWTPSPNFAVMDVLIKVMPPHLLIAEDVRGYSPFHYARKEHRKEWLQFLKERQELLKRRIHLAQIGS